MYILAMVEIPGAHWNNILQPLLFRECLAAGLETMDNYLNLIQHEFTDCDEPNYVIRLYFKEQADEITFRLRHYLGN